MPSKYIVPLLPLALLVSFTPTQILAAPITFYGFDQSGGPLGARPNSDAAQASFLSNLQPDTVGVEDFESVTLGAFPSGTRSLSFGTTSVTGTLTDLTGTTTTNQAAISNSIVAPHWYPQSGSNFFFTEAVEGSPFFDLTLSSPVDSFGFFATSLSDYHGISGGPFSPIRISLDSGTPIDVLNVDPATIQDGSAHFFGVISDAPFSTIRLSLPTQPDTLGFSLTDGIAMDSFTIGMATPEPSAILIFAGLFLACGIRSSTARRRTP